MASPTVIDDALTAFAADVGPDGPVAVRGGGTRRHLGGDVAPGTREVRAPGGIVALEPAEMTVRVRAGTPVAELHDALAESGQRTSLPERPGGTVGGALMVGESGITRLGLGPVRDDALLQARYVCADGPRRHRGCRHRQERQRLRPVPAPGGVPRHDRPGW